jgi:hypothetical protein
MTGDDKAANNNQNTKKQREIILVYSYADVILLCVS